MAQDTRHLGILGSGVAHARLAQSSARERREIRWSIVVEIALNSCAIYFFCLSKSRILVACRGISRRDPVYESCRVFRTGVCHDGSKCVDCRCFSWHECGVGPAPAPIPAGGAASVSQPEGGRQKRMRPAIGSQRSAGGSFTTRRRWCIFATSTF